MDVDKEDEDEGYKANVVRDQMQTFVFSATLSRLASPRLSLSLLRGRSRGRSPVVPQVLFLPPSSPTPSSPLPLAPRAHTLILIPHFLFLYPSRRYLPSLSARMTVGLSASLTLQRDPFASFQLSPVTA